MPVSMQRRILIYVLYANRKKGILGRRYFCGAGSRVRQDMKIAIEILFHTTRHDVAVQVVHIVAFFQPCQYTVAADCAARGVCIVAGQQRAR